jgi:hypothetical protein
MAREAATTTRQPDEAMIERVFGAEPVARAAPDCNGPAPAMNDYGMLAHWSALPQSEAGGIMTTLDLTKRANVITLQNAVAGESTSLWDCEPSAVILVSHLVAHYATRFSEETGEEQSGPMLTLIGPDGIFHTGSQYAFRALQLCAPLCGRPPWHPPIKLRPVRCKSRNDRQYQSIVLVE